MFFTLAGCDQDQSPPPIDQPQTNLPGGDPERGRVAIRQYGCVSCHTVPGVEGGDGVIGPPLARMSRRGYVAGVLKNTPENLQRWIHDPPAVDEKTAMPNLHIPESDIRNIASYLYTLK